MRYVASVVAIVTFAVALGVVAWVGFGARAPLAEQFNGAIRRAALDAAERDAEAARRAREAVARAVLDGEMSFEAGLAAILADDDATFRRHLWIRVEAGAADEDAAARAYFADLLARVRQE